MTMSEDPVNPEHYRAFSNGAETIDISEHLTSNGGQAMQYIVRATRIPEDLRKGETEYHWLEDLNKAKWFIDREIERIGEFG